jgi:hypothetical protein
MKVIVNCEIAKTATDLSKIPAFIDDAGTTHYWGSLTKDIALNIWGYGIELMSSYASSQVGSISASEILGCLEDTYPEWVEEFEQSLDAA